MSRWQATGKRLHSVSTTFAVPCWTVPSREKHGYTGQTLVFKMRCEDPGLEVQTETGVEMIPIGCGGMLR